MQIRWDDLEPLEEMKDGYQPDSQEIVEYAKYLGCFFPGDEKYLPIAKQGLMAPLPPFWQACEASNGQLYFRNKKTRQITADNPLDQIFRQKIHQLKCIQGTYGVQPINEQSALRQSSGIIQSSTLMKRSDFLKVKNTKNEDFPAQSLMEHHITEESVYSEQDEVRELEEKIAKEKDRQLAQRKRKRDENIKWFKKQIENFYPQRQQLITSYDSLPLDYENLAKFMNIEHLKHLIQIKERVAKKTAELERVREENRKLDEVYRNLIQEASTREKK